LKEESKTLSSVLDGSGYVQGQLMIEDMQHLGTVMDEKIVVVASSGHPLFVNPHRKLADGERYHMLLMASETALGLKIWHWLKQLVLMRERQIRFHGPAFCDDLGDLAMMSDYEEIFYDILHEIQDQRLDLIGPDIDIEQMYGFFCSFHQGATTRAREQGVSEVEFDLINCWQKVERELGMKASLAIRDHHTEVVRLKSSWLRFSKPL
jgi:hypothetical protein